MSNSIYRFKVGDFNCAVIRDQDDGERNVLYIHAGQQQVLLDPGAGYDCFPGEPGHGLLKSRLPEVGISADEIDHVIFSHADIDHIGGAVDNNGEPAFPHASYSLLREELAYWSTKPERIPTGGSFADFVTDEVREMCRSVPPARLAQLKDKLELIESGAEIVPGIRGLAIPGHTPGHMAIEIASAGERLLFIGDLFYNPDDIGNAEWHSVVDVDPVQSALTRQRMFEQVAKHQRLLMGYHLPFPALGYIVAHGQGWQWKPLELPAS